MAPTGVEVRGAGAIVFAVALVAAMLPLDAKAAGDRGDYNETGMTGLGLWYADQAGLRSLPAPPLTPRVGVPAALRYDYTLLADGREWYAFDVLLGDARSLHCEKPFDEPVGKGVLGAAAGELVLQPVRGDCALRVPPLDGFFANRVRALFVPRTELCLPILACLVQEGNVDVGRFIVNRTTSLPASGSGGDAVGSWWWGDVRVAALRQPPGAPVGFLQPTLDFVYQLGVGQLFGPQRANDKGEKAGLTYDAATLDWSLMAYRGELECQDGLLFYYPSALNMWPVVGRCALRTYTGSDGLPRVTAAGLLASPLENFDPLGFTPYRVRGCGDFLVYNNGSLGPLRDLFQGELPAIVPVISLFPFYVEWGETNISLAFIEAFRRDLVRDVNNQVPDCSWANFEEAN